MATRRNSKRSRSESDEEEENVTSDRREKLAVAMTSCLMDSPTRFTEQIHMVQQNDRDKYDIAFAMVGGELSAIDNSDQVRQEELNFSVTA